MVTALAFWVDIVPKPVMSVLGIVALAVMADVPLPLTYPVSVAAPEPPDATANGVPRPEIVPPVIVTELAFWVDIVPRPVMSVLGIVADAVMADVPLPLT